MNILILGSGGREHAFAWKLSSSALCSKLYIAPGNAGTAQCGENIAIATTDFEAIEQFVVNNNIQLVVVGPEDPLVKGIYDYFKSKPPLSNIPVIGPSQEGARLEGSKDFSKQFMERHNIPTARYKSFTKESLNDGLAFLKTLKPPYVLKADGLAAGKGVVIPNTLAEAETELKAMLQDAKFGEASSTVVIEEFLKGIELSVFVLTDGNTYKILPAAKDYKRIGEGDTGLNTGGMGAVSPVPFADQAFIDKVEERVVKPTINGLKQDNIDYKGFIFIGLMNVDGNPFVIEYNVRMGDPETEVVLPRIKTDLVELFTAVGNGTLSNIKLDIDDRFATTVMVVAGGYPGDYTKGKVISGLNDTTGSHVFHAGTTNKDGHIASSGGRVLAFTSMDNDMKKALEQSYQSISKVSFEGMYYRKDIGKDLM